tara:strand:+ start:1679 stop:2203 length:525 start_codon:yes stop_codon:yes gene_type:complete
MLGRIVQVATNTVSSPTALIDFGGVIDSNDIYMLVFTNVIPETDANDIKIRITESGTAQSDANYDFAYKRLRTDTTFNDSASTNDNEGDFATSIGNDTGEACSGIVYIYNAYDANEHTMFTVAQIQLSNGALLIGSRGGVVYTQASQVDGIEIFPQAGSTNFSSGTFTMYKVVD